VNPRYPFVSQRAKNRCEYCHAPERVFGFPFDVEHIVPKCRGGTNDDSNLALSCSSCNTFKAGHLVGVDPLSMQDVDLFHPRTDEWTEHFAVDAEHATVNGLTPTGRATVERLQMNSARLAAARWDWIAMGRFP